MMNRFEKVKLHIKENKKAYFMGFGCLLVGAAGGAGFMALKDLEVQQVAKQINVLSPRSKMNVVQIALVERSTPSKPLWDPITKKAYNSKSEAARELDGTIGYINKLIRSGNLEMLDASQ